MRLVTAEQPDASKPTQVAVVGKKGQGKTELAYLLFDSYPYDRVLIDPNGDIKCPEGTIDLDPDDIPVRWPSPPREMLPGHHPPKYQTLRFVPDFHDPDYLAQIDRVVGLAYGAADRKTMLFVDEAHEAAPAGKTPPHMRRALRQGRHHRLSMILATPRPLTVDSLVLTQADWVYVFRLPNPNDRKRVAETIGWDPKDFDEGVHALGEHEYLRFNAKPANPDEELKHYPPLPSHLIKGHRT